MTIRKMMLALFLTALPAAGSAREYPTPNFDHCRDGTPWANGIWQNGDDSATLYLGKIALEGYKDLIGHDKAALLRGASIRLMRETADHQTWQNLIRDTFTTAPFQIERRVETSQYRGPAPVLSVMMIAQASDKSRIRLSVDLPAGTSIADIDLLSRDFAALVRPRQDI